MADDTGAGYDEATGMELPPRESSACHSTHGYDFEDASGAIIGCALEVHRNLGPDFREIVYQRALALEIHAAGLEFEREAKVPIFYEGWQIDMHRADFAVEEVMMVSPQNASCQQPCPSRPSPISPLRVSVSRGWQLRGKRGAPRG